jgi:hypothetical protein
LRDSGQGQWANKGKGQWSNRDSGQSNKFSAVRPTDSEGLSIKQRVSFWAETLISPNSIMTMGQETLEPVETNDIGQVKIASSAKTEKWVWVNAKQCRDILKRRLARLKCEQTRKKRPQRESTWVLRKKQHSNKSSLQICGNKSKEKGKFIDDYALYSPTSTPLTWSFDLYVKELLKVKERLEVVEAKELERDYTIHRIIAENQDLAESNKALKEQVSLLQEDL